MTEDPSHDVVNRAQQLLEHHQYAEVLALLSPQLESQPTAPTLRCAGFAELGLHRLDSAQAHLAKACELDPEDPHIHFGLGLAYAAQNHFNEAISAFDRAMELAPNLGPVRAHLVDALMHQGEKEFLVFQVERGESLLRRAIKLAHGDQRPAIMQAQLFLENHEPGKAKALVQQTLAHPPLSPELLNLAANLQIEIPAGAVKRAEAMPPPAPLPPAAPIHTPQTTVPRASHHEVPCPVCQRLVMEWASICPHCNSRIKDSPASVALSQISTHTWQDIAYRVMSWIWIAYGVLSIVLGLIVIRNMENAAADRGVDISTMSKGGTAYFWVVGIAQIALGIGLLVENETMQFISKILCYLSLAGGAVSLLIGLVSANWGGVVKALFDLGFAGFMIYLINYEGG